MSQHYTFFVGESEKQKFLNGEISETAHVLLVEPGDVLVTLCSPVSVNEEKLNADLLSKSAVHGMIYNGASIIAHASYGRFDASVRTHDMRDVYGLEEHDTFGSVVVYRVKDDKIRQNIAVLSEKSIDCARKHTKFSSNRNEDFRFLDGGNTEKHYQIELFRAFRILHRLNNKEDALSKKQGMRCDNYISYMVKAAVLQTIFSEGIPKDIQQTITAIVQAKEMHGITKIGQLFKMKPELLQNFIAAVTRDFSAREVKKSWLNELVRPVKSSSIGGFVNNAAQHSDFWKMGYFFYNKGAAPTMMSHAAYCQYEDNAKRIKAETIGAMVTQSGLKLYYVKEVEASLQKVTNQSSPSKAI